MQNVLLAHETTRLTPSARWSGTHAASDAVDDDREDVEGVLNAPGDCALPQAARTVVLKTIETQAQLFIACMAETSLASR